MIYLDYNATTPLLPQAFEAMRPYMERHFGNPSSVHSAGREARAAIDESRDRMASLLRAKSHEIIFTGGGTESDNLAVVGLARAAAGRGRHIISSQVEHHAVLHAFDFLEKKEGFQVTRLPVDSEGRIDLHRLEDAITGATTLVSIMSANNETGVLQPVSEASALCRERGIVFHSDMIQSFGKFAIDSREFDAISLAAHKFHGPKGAGVLFVKSGLPIDRLQVGGSHENERRAGTENVAAIAGMATAAEWAVQGMEEEQDRQEQLRDRLWSGIRAIVPDAVCNGLGAERLANTLNVSFPHTEAESLLMNLDLSGICASSGSACMVGSVLPSHVLLAMGVPADLARGTVRFSLGKLSTAEEISRVLDCLPRIFDRLKAA